ncbi:MAG: hypothetical protein WCE75_10095, partial [Terracidiphilus sp.]
RKQPLAQCGCAGRRRGQNRALAESIEPGHPALELLARRLAFRACVQMPAHGFFLPPVEFPFHLEQE